MPSASHHRRLRRRAVAGGVALGATCTLLALAPTYVAAKQSGDPRMACIEVHVALGEEAPSYDFPASARFDWARGSLECSWALPSGPFSVEHNLGSSAQQVGSRVGAGVGLGIAMAGGLFPLLVRRRPSDGHED